MWIKLTRSLEWVLWLGVIALLPITSLPQVSRLFGGSMVAPPSAVLLLGLVMIYLIPAWVRGKALPRQSLPLLGFGLVALCASLSSYFIDFPMFREVGFTRNMLKAGLTLAIGICAYLVSATWAANERRLQTILRWINWSGLVMLAWALAQAYYARTSDNYPEWMGQIQGLFSISTLFFKRPVGLAFEPSWLAHQLNMLYLPLWVAASVRRTSAHRLRLFGISLENLLLLGGMVVLWLTISRVGLLAFLLTIAYLLVLASLWLVSWLQKQLLPKLHLKERGLRLAGSLTRLTLILLVIIVYAGILFGAAQLMIRTDYRMARLFDFEALQQQGILVYANQLVFAERIVFWQVGWEVFNDHPWIGVGLGNAGYFYPEKMSGYGWALTEVNQMIYRDTALPNTKNLWTRLLAETGLAGFGAFLVWLLVLFLTGREIGHFRSALASTLGLAAQLTVVALLLEGFSVDTFALPYFWILFGLATAAYTMEKDL